jgi:hypothetical protein
MMTSTSSTVSKIQKTSNGAYDALRRLFEHHREHVLEIEILPSAIAPSAGEFLVQDDLFVGLSKKVLVSAFLVARDVFSRRNQILAEQKTYNVRQEHILSVWSNEIIGTVECYKHHSTLRPGIPDSSEFPQGAFAHNFNWYAGSSPCSCFGRIMLLKYYPTISAPSTVKVADALAPSMVAHVYIYTNADIICPPSTCS